MHAVHRHIVSCHRRSSLVRRWWCLRWWIGWRSRFVRSTAATPNLRFHRLSPSPSSAFLTFFTTGSGGSISLTSNNRTHEFPISGAAHTLLLGHTQASASLPLPPPALQEAARKAGDSEAAAALMKFLAENSFLSFECWVVADVLLMFGSPTALLLRLTWPMQPTFGDRGSSDSDPDLRSSSHLGIAADSFVAVIEHMVGKKMLLFTRCCVWNRCCLYILPMYMSSRSSSISIRLVFLLRSGWVTWCSLLQCVWKRAVTEKKTVRKEGEANWLGFCREVWKRQRRNTVLVV